MRYRKKDLERIKREIFDASTLDASDPLYLEAKEKYLKPKDITLFRIWISFSKNIEKLTETDIDNIIKWYPTQNLIFNKIARYKTFTEHQVERIIENFTFNSDKLPFIVYTGYLNTPIGIKVLKEILENGYASNISSSTLLSYFENIKNPVSDRLKIIKIMLLYNYFNPDRMFYTSTKKDYLRYFKSIFKDLTEEEQVKVWIFSDNDDDFLPLSMREFIL